MTDPGRGERPNIAALFDEVVMGQADAEIGRVYGENQTHYNFARQEAERLAPDMPRHLGFADDVSQNGRIESLLTKIIFAFTAQDRADESRAISEHDLEIWFRITEQIYGLRTFEGMVDSLNEHATLLFYLRYHPEFMVSDPGAALLGNREGFFLTLGFTLPSFVDRY